MFGYIVFAFIILVCVGIFIGFIIRNKTTSKRASLPLEENYDLKAIDISDIDLMEDGSEFEMYLYRLFLELGYDGVYKTVGARDFGADVVFTDRDGIRNVIQAKRYTDPVGISAVQEVFSCMRYYKAKKAIVIASAKFTEPCETLAGVNHVKLLDRDDLISMIEAFKKDDIRAIKKLIEAEPRMILESWSEANNGVLHEIKKDYKAEKYAKSLMEK
ncbi:restriction system protein [Paenibacillus endophyticus]|uniref:Restriction system protein n=1 Tax=Paenibacillus endophyticus TaxID=1294268 RepID=A0A7W5CB52_9BACL|nr:restriction system protein [Paenibacillus endophyticus]